MARGGKRPGAGRPPGSRNKRTAALIERMEASGDESPVDFLLRTMRDAGVDLQLRLEAARAAAPFVHPRLSAAEVSIQSSVPADFDEAQALADLRRIAAEHPEVRAAVAGEVH